MPARRVSWFLAGCLLLNGCANVPIWSEDEPSEITKGQERHKEILAHIPEYKDEKLAAFVSAVGNKLAAASDRPALKWKFTVLDSPIENAFATMGGYVYITRGLLIYLRDERDLAAVLAHEIAHVCRRDAIHAERRGNAAGLAELGLVLAAPVIVLFPQAVDAPIGMGLSAVRRSDESAADALGTTYLTRAGYPPGAMQDAFDVLNSIEAYKKGLGKVHESWWHRAFADHPETMQRKERIAALNGSQRLDGPETADTQFLPLLDGVEVGNSAVEGIPHNGKRYFADLASDLDVPSGWHVQAFRGRNGTAPGVWLAREKAGVIVIQKHPVFRPAENICGSIGFTFRKLTLEARTPLRSDRTETCTALGFGTFSGPFSEHTYWRRVGIVRLDREYYVTFEGRFANQNRNEAGFDATDQIFVAVAKSIAAVPAKEAPDRPRLRLYHTQSGDSFETLAGTAATPFGGAAFLHAVNVWPPAEKLTPGAIVKVVK
jgi:predicted Zn-dependent protease